MKKKLSALILAVLTMLIWTVASPAAVPVEVVVGKATVITLKEPSTRVSISNPEIADVNLVSPSEILIVGKKVGITNLVVWNKKGERTFFDIKVAIITEVCTHIDSLEKYIKEISPESNVKVECDGDTLVLKGTIKNRFSCKKDKEPIVTRRDERQMVDLIETEEKEICDETIKKIEMLARAYAPNMRILNLITIPEAEQVVLEVKVAQVDKTKLKELGIGVILQGIDGNNAEITFPGFNFFPTGTIGKLDVTEKQILGVGPTGESITVDRFLGKSDIFPGIEGFNLDQNTPQIGVAHFPGGVAALLRALSSKGYAKTLAEPNLIVRSGEKGSFHVGTKFPVQTVRGVGTDATVSVEFVEVGIRLNFIPEVLETGVIRLRVDPAEVSNITDFVRLQNLVAPVIDTRTVKTNVDLRERESLILAGLLSEDMKKNIQKVPLLGDIPIFGALFRSTTDELRERELVFFITPKHVKPIAPDVKPELPGTKPLTPDEEREFRWIPFPKGKTE